MDGLKELIPVPVDFRNVVGVTKIALDKDQRKLKFCIQKTKLVVCETVLKECMKQIRQGQSRKETTNSTGRQVDR